MRLTRKEFLRSSFLAAVGAGLMSCAPPDRLADMTPTGPLEPSLTPSMTPSPSADTAMSTPTYTSTPLRTPTQTHISTPAASPTVQPLADVPYHRASYYTPTYGNAVRCHLCFRECSVLKGKRGFCRNRANIDGRYYTLVYGRPSALQIDPIEKEPCFHMLPGSMMFCTGTASCNNRCKFCHNWELSQRSIEDLRHEEKSPEATVRRAREQECDTVSFTYNEPTVFYEHMFDVTILAKRSRLRTLFHTNGGISEKPLAALLEHMDAVTVDLKAFSDDFYRRVCDSRLPPVLRTLRQIRESGVHLEIVNLVIPTLNDDMKDIRRMCLWIKEDLGVDVPLHFTRFFPSYLLTRLPSTPIDTLEQAAGIADDLGLHYVYIGNCPGHERNSTFCPNCRVKIIERVHFSVRALHVDAGKCRFCGHAIPGVWRSA